MKSVRMKPLLAFILIMIMYFAFSGITVYGGYEMYLIDDYGGSPWLWNYSYDKAVSVASIGDGPSGGNPGAFYYLTNRDGDREIDNALIAAEVNFNENQKILCSLGQLYANFSLNYYGWEDDDDRFTVYLYSITKDGLSKNSFYTSDSYSGNKSWKSLSKTDIKVPKGTIKIRMEIFAVRGERGSDLDVYLDNIRLSVYDNYPPVMTSATVTEIRDSSGAAVPLKKDPNTGEYLDNWVNCWDTIYGKVEYNEPVTIDGYLITNMLPSYSQEGYICYGNVPNGSTPAYSHEYEIPLMHADRLIKGDSAIKFRYLDEGGPFDFPVCDLGGNDAQYVQQPNIEQYKLKLDNASPIITTPWKSYETFVPGRTSVDIEIREEDGGTPQSPLTLTYNWEYYDTNNTKVTEPEKKILVSSVVAPVKDGTNTTYTVNIDLPNGSTIPPYQDFWLSAEVNDEARNPYSNRWFYGKVDQKDDTPPVITWDKSIDEYYTLEGIISTEVDISTSEDDLYAMSRKVYFSVNDPDSGVEDVKYLWTKEPYNAETDIISQMVLPGKDGKYEVQGTSDDAPLEGLNYLNILAANGTATETVKSKAFYFDNQGPRVIDTVFHTDGNPTSAQYEVEDRALQNKFLYTILTFDSESRTYEPIVEPDISEGLKDDGMWKALEMESLGSTRRTASIIGVLDKITQTGYYMLVTRYYDEYYNCTQIENGIQYDFIPPEFEVVDAGEPSTFQQNHDIVIRIYDNMSYVDLWGDDLTFNWIDAESGEEIPASYEIEPQMEWISIEGSEAFNGRYYLNVKAEDYACNVMDEIVFINGSRAEFCFDNSSPSVNISYNNEKTAKTVGFSYSEFKDAYTGAEFFKYGISVSPDIEPSEWIDIDPSCGEGNIAYPYEFAGDGEWYLHMMLGDTLGNEQRICSPEPFRIDVTKPSGSIAFVNGYINKLYAPLELKIDELTSTEREIVKTILSGNKAMLEDEVISDVQPTDWKDITFENGLAIYNWMLSDIEDGEQRVYARFMDEAGNMSGIYESAVILDRTAPTGSVAYDVTEPTIGNVTAALTMSDNNTVTLLNNNQVSSYVFNRNGEFEFVLMDNAGNKTRIKAVVENIDKDPPKASVSYSHPRHIWTNESITATLQLEDINGFNILSEGGNTHKFDENGEFIFLFEDSLGNQGSIKAEVKNIDKEVPKGSIVYSYSDTAPVTVYLAVYEPVEVTNNDGSFRYVFDENGEFTFEFEDKAGNLGEATAVVDTITSAEKYVNIMYGDSGGLTKENIEAVFTPVYPLSCITSPTVAEEVYGSYTYDFTDNGDYPVSIRVLSGTEAGSIRTVTGSVYNIDRAAPNAEVYISTTEFTNQDVIATLLVCDDRGKAITIESNGGKSEHVFEDNGTFTFEFKDEAGNIGDKEIRVSNIDKSTPEAEIIYYTDETKPNSVFAEVYFPEETGEVFILNNNGSDTFEFVENGAFSFRYADKAGNTGEATARVSSLPGSVSEGSIEYYIEGNKIDNPNKVITNKSVTAKLVLGEAGGPYPIVNNGGSSSYTFEQNGEFTFVYENSKGNRGFATAKVGTIDKEAPKLQILADTVRVTNKDVIVTVSYSDNKGILKVIHNMEAENIISSEGKLVYTCTGNKKIEVTVIDTAGNETKKVLDIDYIDKEMPIGTIEYTPKSITNQNVKAILTLNEPGKILTNSGKMEYIFTQNGDFVYEFEDIAGNKASVLASVNWIDKIPPSVSLEYSNTSMTNKPVVVTLKTEDNAVILSNGGASKRTFYRNGEFTFRVMDSAGNEANIKAEVKNIDADKPQITLKGSSYLSIFQNEAYIEEGYTAMDNIDGDLTSKVAVEGSVNTEVSGIYILKYKVSDATGNIGEVSRTVKVLGLDEIVLLLNGKVADGENIILEDVNVLASVIGNEGSCKLKWAKGKKTQAYFKTEGNNIADGAAVKLDNGSWYTFFIQDRERKTKCIRVYINE